MGISQNQEFAAVFYMFLCGILCGSLYDIIRISRVFLRLSSYTCIGGKLSAIHLPLIGCSVPLCKRNFSHCLTNILLGAGDTLFGVISGCLFSVFLAHFADGVFRWFFAISAVIGFVLYYLTLGRLIMSVSEIIVGVIRIIFRYCIWGILLPFRALQFLLCCLIRRTNRHIILPLKDYLSFRADIRFTERKKAELPHELILLYERSD